MAKPLNAAELKAVRAKIALGQAPTLEEGQQMLLSIHQLGASVVHEKTKQMVMEKMLAVAAVRVGGCLTIREKEILDLGEGWEMDVCEHPDQFSKTQGSLLEARVTGAKTILIAREVPNGN